MNTQNLNSIKQIQLICPLQCNIAYCLTQLRKTQIQFLNLGSLIICPEQKIVLIFKEKCLLHIEKIPSFA